MSRLIVKGLPARYKAENLRQLFSFSGDLTDAKVIHTKDGKSRQFGFVGFRTTQAAKIATKRVHRSFVDTARVTVEVARTVGADDIPRPWSKYSKGSSRFDQFQQQEEGKERKHFLKKEKGRLQSLYEARGKESKSKPQNVIQSQEDSKDEGTWKAFQEVAQRRSANPVWADGALQGNKVTSLVESRKSGGKGKMLERQHVTFEESDEEDQLYEEPPKKQHTDDNTAGDVLALSTQVSDLDYFKSKVIAIAGTHAKEPNTASGSESAQETERDPKSEPEEKPSDDKEKVLPAGKSTNVDKAHTELAVDSEQASKGTKNKSKDHASSKLGPRIDETRKRYEADGVNASETGRLLVRNLAFATEEDDLEAIFDKFGMLSEVHIVRDAATSRSRGMGFVQFIDPENAVSAMTALDGTFQNGRILHVLPAKPRPQAPILHQRRLKPGSSSFKEKRESDQKYAAGKGLDAVSQDPMHLSANAIAEIVAERHGVTKGVLLGTTQGESGTAAVRLAMAEADIQGETKKYLAERGVNLTKAIQVAQEIAANTASAQRKRLSRTAFLVKNLPARTTEEDLESVFGKFGSVARVIVVPSGLLSVVIFKTATDAKRAYNSLAYTKFGDTPLYLEWLPSEALTDLPKESTANYKTTNSPEQEEDEHSKHKDVPAETQKSNAPATVYVKNLNFETRNDGLKEHFMRALRKRNPVMKSLRSAKVAMKKGGPGKESQTLSMGFGFLEFVSRENAIEAVKIAQNSSLDGHVLQLRLSTIDEDEGSEVARKRKRVSKKGDVLCPKLMVRNLAFEATRKDVRELFSSFGQLKTIRLPKKPDGSHRGFAFVEFVSKTEAKAAFEALTSTHLYGRHLVVEYAADKAIAKSSVKELQDKTALHVRKKQIRLNNSSFAEQSANGVDDVLNDDEERIRDSLYG